MNHPECKVNCSFDVLCPIYFYHEGGEIFLDFHQKKTRSDILQSKESNKSKEREKLINVADSTASYIIWSHKC